MPKYIVEVPYSEPNLYVVEGPSREGLQEFMSQGYAPGGAELVGTYQRQDLRRDHEGYSNWSQAKVVEELVELSYNDGQTGIRPEEAARAYDAVVVPSEGNWPTLLLSEENAHLFTSYLERTFGTDLLTSAEWVVKGYHVSSWDKLEDEDMARGRNRYIFWPKPEATVPPQIVTAETEGIARQIVGEALNLITSEASSMFHDPVLYTECRELNVGGEWKPKDTQYELWEDTVTRRIVRFKGPKGLTDTDDLQEYFDRDDWDALPEPISQNWTLLTK